MTTLVFALMRNCVRHRVRRFAVACVCATCGSFAISCSAAEENSAVKDAIPVLERVPPTPPQEALQTIEIADGFRIEQVAAEPLVVDPVAMAFDEHGRLYVVEMRDYSEQDKERLGRVRLLIDDDGDGFFDKSHVFADDLSWPTAIICYDGGVFVGSAPEILYLKDTTGDGVADERRVVFTGFGRHNVQGLINSFEWGLDHRIHGSTSSTGGSVTRPGSNSPPLELRGRDFAFDPRTLQMEATTGGGQHGMTFNRWGDRFVCHNSDHLQAIVLEERYLARNPYHPVVSARRSIAADGPQAAVYRASPIEAWRVARTEMRLAGLASGPIEAGGRAAGYFTSATGVTVYEGGLWPTPDAGLVFVADVGSNLIHRKRLMADGVTYRGERIDKETEFIRSTDIWFRPVQMTIGPEGALYIADMHREVIEHPASLPPELKRQLDLTSGNDRGRIYRIVPADYQPTPRRALASATTKELIETLDHPNAWQRATASRLLFERQDSAAGPLLRRKFASSKTAEAHITVMYALKAAQALTAEDVWAALNDRDAQIRRHALRLAEPLLDADPRVRDKAFSLSHLVDPVVQFQLALTLGECSDARATALLADIIRDASNRDIIDAAFTSLGERAGGVLQALLADDAWLATPRAEEVLGKLVAQIVRQQREEDVAMLVEVLKSSDAALGSEGASALLKALSRLPSDALAGTSSPYVAELQRLRQSAAAALVREARRLLEQDGVSLPRRVAAIQNLGLDRFETQRALLEELLSPQEPAAVHAAVLEACVAFDAPDVAELVLSRWAQFAPGERSRATELLLRRQPWALALVRYIEAEGVPLTTLEPGHVARLVNYPAKPVRELALKLRGQSTSGGRQRVFDDYRDVSLAGGDSSRGKAVFEKNCATCHQLSGSGEAVGPSLAAMVSRGAESLLFNILVPNGEVEPRFLEYVVMTSDGQVVAGMIAGETSTAVTLRGGDNKTTTILRVDIEEMHNTGKSLMPEGFEKEIDREAMADLLAYILEAAAKEGAAP